MHTYGRQTSQIRNSIVERRLIHLRQLQHLEQSWCFHEKCELHKKVSFVIAAFTIMPTSNPTASCYMCNKMKTSQFC